MSEPKKPNVGGRPRKDLPRCRQCGKRLPSIRGKRGWRGNGLFCSQFCGHAWAESLLLKIETEREPTK